MSSSNIISSFSQSTAGNLDHKRRKQEHHDQQQQPSSSLLPELPDHIAQLCLSRVNPSILYSVSHSWRRLIYSPSFPPFKSIYALLSPLSSKTTDTDTDSIQLSSFDPISFRWVSLPQPSAGNLVIRHPAFMSRNLSFQSVTVSGKLVILAGTNHQLLPALPRPLIFDPAVSQHWSSGPPIASPRRWCAAGSVQGSVVVASGIGCNYNQQVARSVEKWDLSKFVNPPANSCWSSGGKRRCDHTTSTDAPDPIIRTPQLSVLNRKMKRSNISSSRNCYEYGGSWEKLGSMRDTKFSREAIDAVGWRGKLCMVNVKGDFAKEGVVYDLITDQWEDMPKGMLAGWRGPVGAMDEDTIYAVDESRGVLRKYDSSSDEWDVVMDSEKLRGAEHLTASGGRVCIVCRGGDEIVVVDVVALPSRFWVVESPVGFQVVHLHILPRMSHPTL